MTWDASRSFDPIGGRLVHFEWNVGSGPPRHGAKVPVHYPRSGNFDIVLYVTDDGGLTGTAYRTVGLP